jgi:diguanylate cyclase (GGDEF)-like protein/PAS domain S-box-containing protein
MQLSRSESLLRITESLSRVGGWEWDVEEQTMFWTNGLYRLHELDPDELTPGAPEHIVRSLECYPPEDRLTVQTAFNRCVEAGEPFDLELRFTSVKGRQMWVRTVAYPVIEGGRVVRVLGNFMDTTDRRLIEQELREKEEKYRLVVENSSDVILTVDRAGRILMINRPPAGLRAEDVIGTDVVSYVQPEHRSMVRSEIERVFDAGEPGHYEIRARGPHDSVSWYETRLSRMCDYRETPMVLLVTRDVTERRQMEDALRASESKYRLLVENQNDLVVQAGLDMRIMFVSPTYCTTFGMSEEELIGSSFFTHIIEEDRPFVERSLERVLVTPYSSEHEDRAWTISGWRWFAWSVKGVLSDDGQVTSIIGVGRDVTERKQAEYAVHESEVRFRTIFENAPVMINAFDEQGRCMLWNSACERTFGWTIDEVKANELPLALFYPDPEVRQRVLETVSTNPSGRFMEWNPHTKWGAVLTCMWANYRLPDGTVMNIGYDITEQKRAEQQIRHASLHDGLTGLYNRVFLDQEMERLDTPRQLPMSIIVADVNGLKLINDAYGHSSGDELLKRCAEILREACREEDIIARWGGDEFVILLPQTQAEHAESIEERIGALCRGIQVRDVPVSIALGLSTKYNQHVPLSAVLREAEEAMYRNKTNESAKTKRGFVKALASALEQKGLEDIEHILRMQTVARAIGKAVRLPYAELERLDLLISVHDIGKVGIPEEILKKDGPLSPSEWEVARRHSEIGYRIARTSEDFIQVADDILAHHEHWDGSGYPKGLKGAEIPLLARITNIADAYEVMSKGRPYREPLTHSQIVKEFQRCSGSQFDPELVKVLLAALDEGAIP